MQLIKKLTMAIPITISIMTSCFADIKAQDKPKALCVFDYDLTLSSHGCPEVPDDRYVCPTYEWYLQGISLHAEDAIKRCIDEGAYVGILSLSPLYCHETKIPALIEKVPDLKNLIGPPSGKSIDISSIDQWNLEKGPFYFKPTANKSKDINRIMKFYGLKPGLDDHLVIFWDDEIYNIRQMKEERPNINSIRVKRISDFPHKGCGIDQKDIDDGFRQLKDRSAHM